MPLSPSLLHPAAFPIPPIWEEAMMIMAMELPWTAPEMPMSLVKPGSAVFPPKTLFSQALVVDFGIVMPLLPSLLQQAAFPIPPIWEEMKMIMEWELKP